MARNGSGTYTVPNTFVAGTTITASDHNENWSDIGSEITNSVATDGQTTMTGPLKASNGSVSAPSLTFGSDTDTGFYRVSADTIGVAIGGANVLSIGSSGFALTTIDIIGATQVTTPATDDTLPLYDLSATANRRILVSDLLKVINSFTEDTAPDITSDFLLSYDTSASAVKKLKPQNFLALPRGYIDGCTLSNNGSDATNDIDIAAGVCRDSTNAVNITVPAITGKQLDANWVAGSSAGMRNSAVGIANGTYHIWAARTATSETGDIYAHTSTTAATVLAALQAESGGSSYAYLRRIGSIIREAGAIVAFIQRGDVFQRKTPVVDNDTSNTTNGSLATLSVPDGIVVEVSGSFVHSAASNVTVYFSNPSQTDSAPSTTVAPLGSFNAQSVVETFGPVATDTSRRIRYRPSVASVNFGICVWRWVDARGKDG